MSARFGRIDDESYAAEERDSVCWVLHNLKITLDAALSYEQLYVEFVSYAGRRRFASVWETFGYRVPYREHGAGLDLANLL